METFTDDTVVSSLASFLSPHDMLSLALSCKRFGAKNGTTDKKRSADRGESTREESSRTESISLMEVAARTVLHVKWTDEEKSALPRRGDESWIGLYQEFLKLFRLPLQFDKLVSVNLDYVDSSDKTKIYTKVGAFNGAAICSNIMRAGKHTVYFQMNANDSTNYEMLCGIMRPTTKDITSLERCNPASNDLSRFSLKEYETLHNDNVDCYLMDTSSGFCLIRPRWKIWKEFELMAMDEEQRMEAQMQNLCLPKPSLMQNWVGMEETEQTSFKIGFVLDLDEGTLDVYDEDDRHLGTMKRGLVGEYCWVASLFNVSETDEETSVTIGR